MGFIDIHYHRIDDSKLFEQLLLTNQKLEIMSEQLDELLGKTELLNKKVTELQAAIDADQAADAEVVAALKAQNEVLEAQIANGSTPEDLTAVKQSIEAAIARIETATSDVANTHIDNTAGPKDPPAEGEGDAGSSEES